MFNMKRSVDSLLMVKCLSIVLVVANHSALSKGLHGGLNGLMLVSGIVMATFAFKDSTEHTLRAFRNFAIRLAIPSFILALIWAIAYGEYNWSELFFFRNWLTKARLVSFPIWYPQVMVQMLAVFACLFLAFNLTPKLISHPKKITSLSFFAALCLCFTSYALWDTTYLHDKLPHLLAWNFIFGWLYWAFLVKDERTLENRLILTATLCVTSYLVFIQTGAIFGQARFLWFTLFGLILIWINDIKLPFFTAHIFHLIGQSTLYIFLWHYPAFGITLRLGRLLGVEHLASQPVVLLLSGLIYPILLWAGISALKRGYAHTKGEYPAQAA